MLGVLVALVIASSGGVARAAGEGDEPTPAELRAAAEAFDHGREAYKGEHYGEAAEQFERADGSAPSATALGLAMKSRDKAGDLDRAGTIAALALVLYPDDPEIQKVAPELLQRARSSLFELSITCAEPCELADGTKIVHGVAAKQRTLFLTEGQHSLRAGFPDGRTESKPVEATGAGTSGQLSFEGAAPVAAEPEQKPPEPEPAQPPPEPKPEEAKKSGGLPPVVFWIGVGATAVAGGITVWSGIDTVNNPGEQRVRDECIAGDQNCAVYQEGRSKQMRTNVLIGVTAGLAVTTGLLAALAIDWGGASAAPDDAAARLHPHVEPFVALGDGASIGARGTF